MASNSPPLKKFSIWVLKYLRLLGSNRLRCFSLIRRVWWASHSCQALADIWLSTCSPLAPGSGATSKAGSSCWYFWQKTVRVIVGSLDNFRDLKGSNRLSDFIVTYLIAF